MVNVAVFVRSNNCWDQTTVYIDHETMGVLVPSGTTINLLNTLFKVLKLKPENHIIGIKYVVELEISLVKILDDLAVDLNLELQKNKVDKTKFPLCLDITEERMGMTIEGSYTKYPSQAASS